MTFQDLYKQF